MIEMVRNPDKGPSILVVGVGGAGSNAVDNMAIKGLPGVTFLVINTDAQALAMAKTETKLHVGKNTTKGLGTGANPRLGEQAAHEDREAIREALDGADLVFITCGLGGGTGTGASPVIADIAKEVGSLTVAITTKPFDFEGSVRKRHAEQGQSALRSRVDTLITIPNQRLLKVVDEKTSLVEAFRVSDGVLMQCVQSISDLITRPGLINLDFADIRAIMNNPEGRTAGAVMGVGFGKGEGKAMKAFQQASSSPLMEEVVLEGAKNILINVTSGPEMTLYEISRAIEEQINPRADKEANIIFGVVIDENMHDEMKVVILATGFPTPEVEEESLDEEVALTAGSLAHNEDDFEKPAYLNQEKSFIESVEEEEEPEVENEDKDEEHILPNIFGLDKFRS